VVMRTGCAESAKTTSTIDEVNSMSEVKLTLNGDLASAQDILDYLDGDVDRSKLTGLSDTPADYAGQGGKFLAVNTAEDGTEFVDGTSGPSRVESVFGRAGTIVAEAGDYTADDVTETVANKIMTASERQKLAGIEAGATADQSGSEIVSLLDSELGGSKWQGGGGGITGAEIVAAINAELGNTDWQKAGGGTQNPTGPVEFIEFIPTAEPDPPAAGCKLYYDDSVTEKNYAFEIRYANGEYRRVYTASAKT